MMQRNILIPPRNLRTYLEELPKRVAEIREKMDRYAAVLPRSERNRSWMSSTTPTKD